MVGDVGMSREDMDTRRRGKAIELQGVETV